jgi:hypothetical protein
MALNLETGALQVTGAVTGSNLNVSDWDTAFGWGDHASGGYAPTSNPTFTGEMTLGQMQASGTYVDFTQVTSGAGGMRFYNSVGTLQGYVYQNGSQTFGLLHSGGGWAIGCQPAGAAVDITPNLNALGGLDVTGTLTCTGDAFFDMDVLIDANYGYSVVGLYSATKYQGVWAMGSAYTVTDDGSTLGTLYGLAWTHTNNTQGQAKSGLSHQLLVVENGVTKVAIGSGLWVGNYTSTFGGNIAANGNIVGDGATTISGIETITVDSTGDITKSGHGNYLYHQSTTYDDDQEGGITFSTSAPSGGADGDIWFEYT